MTRFKKTVRRGGSLKDGGRQLSIKSMLSPSSKTAMKAKNSSVSPKKSPIKLAIEPQDKEISNGNDVVQRRGRGRPKGKSNVATVTKKSTQTKGKKTASPSKVIKLVTPTKIKASPSKEIKLVTPTKIKESPSKKEVKTAKNTKSNSKKSNASSKETPQQNGSEAPVFKKPVGRPVVKKKPPTVGDELMVNGNKNIKDMLTTMKRPLSNKKDNSPPSSKKSKPSDDGNNDNNNNNDDDEEGKKKDDDGTNNNNNNDDDKTEGDNDVELLTISESEINDIIEVVPIDSLDKDELESNMSSDDDTESRISTTSSTASTVVKSMDPNSPSFDINKKKQCPVCFRGFPNRYFLRKHRLKEHENQVYKCKVCEFYSVDPEKLKNHIIKMHVAKKDRCDRSTEDMDSALKSLFNRQVPRKVVMEDGVVLGRTVKSTIGFGCAICECVYPSRYSLERHVRTHTGEKPYQCQVCNFTTSYHEHMMRHMTSVHLVVHSDEPRPKYVPKNKKIKEEGNDQEEEGVFDPKTGKIRRKISRKRYECAACGLKATHKTDLVDHIKGKHPNAHIESMTNRDGSKIHLIVTVSKKPKEQKRLTITCLFCSKVFHDTWKYKTHLRSHTGVKPFRCSSCGFRATNKMTVRDHVHRKHANDPNAKIVIRTVGIDGVVEEVEIPIPHREYKCEFCNQQFSDNYLMKTHRQQTHPESQPFSCTLCDRRETAKAVMIIHCMTDHKGSELDELILRYGKPFKIGSYKVPTCDICGGMFGYQSQLYNHQRNHTGERTYNCDNCDYGSNSKIALEKHMMKAHLGLAIKKESNKGGKRKKTLDDSKEDNEDKNYTCIHCDLVVKTKLALKKHISIHQIENAKRGRKPTKKDASTAITADIEQEQED